MFDGKELRVLYSEEKIAERIKVLGEQITADNQGKDLVIVGELKGSFLFIADLIRQIDLPCSVDFLGLSSYGEDTKSSGVVRITRDLAHSIADKHVLVVEDIVDTGLTMRHLLEIFETRKPASVQICTLLHKPVNQKCELDIAYVGFTIENHFVIGYGLDLAEKYRNLPYIGYLV